MRLLAEYCAMILDIRTNRPDIQEKLDRYLAEICPVDANRLHFFDESSVVITSGNRKRGHSAIGKPAFEMQRYASNATLYAQPFAQYSRSFSISHFSISRGPSNGLELLNFFNQGRQSVLKCEGDRLENEGDRLEVRGYASLFFSNFETLNRYFQVLKAYSIQ